MIRSKEQTLAEQWEENRPDPDLLPEAHRLRDLRRAIGRSMREVCKEIGWSPKVLSDIEHATVAPTPEQVATLEAFYRSKGGGA